MNTLEILGSAMGLGLLAGVRLYFTVFALGMAMRFGWFEPNETMSSLHVLEQTPVLIASGAAFVIEFFADKIPWLDSLWDSVHTFIRPIGAAVLGATALGSFDPTTQVMIGLLTGGFAFTGHASKAATRIAVNHSPEPFSNWALSFAEDLMVPAGLWVVFEHPVVALFVALAAVIVFAIVARAVFRLLRQTFTSARSGLARLAG